MSPNPRTETIPTVNNWEFPRVVIKEKHIGIICSLHLTASAVRNHL